MGLKSFVKKQVNKGVKKGKSAAKKVYGGKVAKGIATLSGIRGVVKTTKGIKSSKKGRTSGRQY